MISQLYNPHKRTTNCMKSGRPGYYTVHAVVAMDHDSNYIDEILI